MDLAATFLGGLGLFFLGAKALSAGLAGLTDRRLRAGLAALTSRPGGSAVAGVVLGVVTQSSSAASFISASMVAGGMLPAQRALGVVLWAGLGTAVLVLLAAFDLRLAALWLLAVAGIGATFGIGRVGQGRALMGMLGGLGLLLLGLAVIKTGAAPLGASALMREVARFAGSALLPAALAGVVVTLMVQSASTVTILALTLSSAGLLTEAQTVMVVHGAFLGSGLAILLLGGSGPLRRLGLWQALARGLGTAVFAGIYLAEYWGGVPLLQSALAGVPDPQARAGVMFALLQGGTALLASPFAGVGGRVIDRLLPPSPAEALARPEFLFEEAAEDPPSALDLVAREQARLAAALPDLLDHLREEGTRDTGNAEGLRALEGEIARFLAELLGQGLQGETLARAIALEQALGDQGALRSTLEEFAAEAGAAHASLRPILARLAEALHLLLLQYAEATGDAAEAATLVMLTEDRGPSMAALRRRAALASPAPEAQAALMRATAQTERAVWLLRRLALPLAA